MKKIIVAGIAIIALSVSIVSCKKGENDPFLSLKSRKARVVGEWTLTKVEGTYSDIDPADASNSTSSTTTYSNGLETVTTTDGSGNSSVQTDSYTVDYSFTKDQKYTITTTRGTTVDVEEGDWLFMGKNKTDKIKNKEGIYLIKKTTSSTSGGVTVSSPYTGVSNGMPILIDQLKSKEIVLINESSIDWGTDKETTSTKMTLTAK